MNERVSYLSEEEIADGVGRHSMAQRPESAKGHVGYVLSIVQ